MLLGSYLLYFLRFGYDYANSDQDEVIPFLLHRLDPGLFTQDWFVATQVHEFSVRTYFVWLLNAFSIIFPVWTTTLIIYLVAWILIAAAVYKLAFYFTSDPVAAAASVVVALVLTPMWTLGGNDLVHSMLVASMLAWGMSLWAIYHYLRGRFLIAPVLLGVACWIQALVALHVAILLVVLRTIRWIQREPSPHNLGGILVFGALFALWSSPALGPLIYQQILVQPETLNPDPSLFYILAEFRLPHHYLPGSFYLGAYIRFAALGLLGLGSLFWFRYRRGIQGLDFIIRALILIALFCVIATMFTEFFPVLLIAKLQLFKMTVLAKLFFVILICGAVAFWLPNAVRRPIRIALRRPGWSLTIVAIVWIGVGAAVVISDGVLHERVGPFRRAEQPIGMVQTWAKRNTPISSIFAVPPSFDSFRSEAHRTIVINYKAIPYEDEQMVTWFERLTNMAPIELQDRGGRETLAQLDSAYANLTEEELRDLSEQYRFNYVVRPKALTFEQDTLVLPTDTSAVVPEIDPPLDEENVMTSDTTAAPQPRRFEEVFRAGHLYVYRLSAPAAAPGAAQ